MKKKLMAFALAAVTAFCAAFGGSYPSAQTSGAKLNTWTKDYYAAKSAAASTGNPYILLIVNTGCSLCSKFMDTTINTTTFKEVLAEYPCYLVILNWSESSLAKTLFSTYNTTGYTPVFSLFDSDGSLVHTWDPHNISRKSASAYLKYLLSTICVNGTTLGFDATEATVEYGTTYSGAINRSGESGESGTATLTLSGDNADRYTLSPTTLEWGEDDEPISFTVTPNSTDLPDSEIVSDTLTVTLSNGDFDTSTVTYESSTLTLTVTDPRASETLAEFAEDADIGTLASSDAAWYVPADGSATLQALSTTDTATLTWTSETAGVLTVAAVSSDAYTVSAQSTAEADAYSLTAESRIGVAAGDSVTFTFTPVGSEAYEAAFSTFSFESLEVTLVSPTNGQMIAGADLSADNSLADLTWDAGGTASACTVTVAGTETTLATPTDTTLNAVTASETVQQALADESDLTVEWQVAVTYDASCDYGTASATASASFDIAHKPVFTETVGTDTVYLKASTTLDVSATGGSGITYSASGLPKGLTIDAETGVVSGTASKAGTYKVTVTATNASGSTSQTVTIVVAKFPSALLKGTYIGVLLDGDGVPAGALTFKISSSGSYKTTFYAGASTSTVKTGLEISDSAETIVAYSTANDSLELSRDADGVWSGTWGSYTVVAKVIDNSATAANYNFSAEAEGISTLKYSKKGKASVSGYYLSTKKTSLSGYGATLTAEQVATYLPDYADLATEEAIMVPVYKKNKGSGLIVLGDNDLGRLHVVTSSTVADQEGSIFATSEIDQTEFQNGSISVTTGEDILDTACFSATAKKPTLLANDLSMKFKYTVKTGLFSGSYTYGGVKYKYIGCMTFDADDNAAGYGLATGSGGSVQGIYLCLGCDTCEPVE